MVRGLQYYTNSEETTECWKDPDRFYPWTNPTREYWTKGVLHYWKNDAGIKEWTNSTGNKVYYKDQTGRIRSKLGYTELNNCWYDVHRSYNWYADSNNERSRQWITYQPGPNGRMITNWINSDGTYGSRIN